MRKTRFLLAAVFMAMFVLSGCAAPAGNAGADNSLQSVLDSGVLRVGMCPEYPPFESINANNEIVGFDPALAAAIAAEWGVEVECVNTPWEGLIAGVNNGDFDIIMSAMSPEEATAATDAVELSDNYYVLADIIVVRAADDSIQAKEDLNGKTIGVQDASSAAQAAEALPDMGITVKALKHYNRNAEAYAELANGRIDAIIVSSSYAAEQARHNPEFKVVNDPLHEIGIAVVAKQGAGTLIDKVNETVTTLKENGQYDSIVVEWLAAE